MLAVFFDLDDTLMDHSGAERSAALLFFQSVADRTDSDSAEVFARKWNVVQERHVQRFLSGEFSFQEQRRARIRDVLCDEVSDSEADEVFSIYLKHYEDSWRRYPDVIPCLEALTAKHVAVLTNGDPRQQQQKLTRTGLAEHFSDVVVSGAVGHAKPDHRIFHIACERAGVEPSEAVHIGDSKTTDYDGACRAGLRAILLDRSQGAHRDPTITVVRSLEEVPSVIAAL